MMYEFKEQDAYAFARHIGVEATPKGDELPFNKCPYCHGGRGSGDKKTFSINLRTGQFKCLRESCGVKGNMIQLSRDFDFSLGNDIDEYYQPKKRYRTFKRPEKPVEPKSAAIKYLQGRGISEEVAVEYELTIKEGTDNILVFPFYDERGDLRFIKYRKTDFDKEKDNSKEWCEKDCKPILFGMKQCKGFHRLIITEGQMDSLSVAAAGIENAVSVPTGAKGFTWVPYCFDWVRKFEEIIVFGDFEKGKMSLLEDISKRFPQKIRKVREEDYKGCKDANEILQKYGPEAVKDAVEKAEILPIKRVISLADVESVNVYELPKLGTGINAVDRFLYGGLPFGQLCIIGGKRGDGKSTLTSQILANAIDLGFPVFAYSGELPNHLFKAWMDFQMAGPQHILEKTNDFGDINRYISNSNQSIINDWYRERAHIYDNRIIEGDEKEDLIRTVEKAIQQYGIKVVLIDNLMTAMFLDEVKGSDKYDQQGRFVRKLTELALRYDVLILLVAHRRKNAFSSDANDEISGSGDITNLAGVVMSYDRGSEKDGVRPNQRKLVISKNRLFGKVNFDGFILDYDEKSKRIFASDEELRKEYGWNKDKDGFQNTGDMEIPF